jgi:hypothetical protein
MNWNVIYKISSAWLFVATAILLYNTYLMWFADTHLEWLQPDYQLKTGVLIFPALALFYFARFKIGKAHADQDT